MPGTQSVSVSGNGSTNTHYNWKQQRPVDLNNLSCICSTVSFRGNIPLVLACHVAFWYATNFHILTISIKNLLLIKKSSSLWKGSSCWLLLDLGTTWGSVGRLELNKWPRSSRMCSPCYNNSFYVACPASPWCDTAEPGQVNSCLTECSSYGLAPQARPRPYPGPCIFSWLLSVYPQLLHLACHQRKNIPSLYSTENHQGCKKKGQVFSLSLACLPLVLQP